MDFFFEPKGIAVVGATPERYQGGQYLVTNLTLGYTGPVYPVNPKYDEVLGLKCYPKVSDIEGPLDLALIFVPAPTVPQVLKDCVMKGLRGAIIQSSGFAEIGPEGKSLQNDCLDIARKGNLRIWGPNCMGLIDTSKRHVFSFITPEVWKAAVNPGHISLIVQSGLLSAGFITTLMGNKTIGLAKVCSIGNKSDVEETELLEYLLKDPETKVIALYLESFMNGRRFFELAASSDKPIVLLKGGKGPLGAEASVSHTASLAGNYPLIEGVLKQAGIHRADDFFEMVDIARTLERDFSLPSRPDQKPRIAILSYSGASGIVTADHMEKQGLTLARLSSQTQKRLEELSPGWMPVRNPVDYWPAMEKHGPSKAYIHAMKALHDDPEIDGLIIHVFAGFGAWALKMKEIMSGMKHSRKPVLFWLLGPEKVREPTRLALEEDGWPTFSEINRTVKVMASVFERTKRRIERSQISQLDTFDGATPPFLNRGLRTPLSINPEPLDCTQGFDLVERHTTALDSTGSPSRVEPRERQESRWVDFPVPASLEELATHAIRSNTKILDEHESKKWFKILGLRVVEEVIVRDLDEAVNVADKMGYPVVLKGRSPGKIHKTEAGLVKLNLWNADQVTSASQEMLHLKSKPESVVVQPMLKRNLELIVGITRDPQFGPAAMLGLGGVQAEVYKDVTFRLVPLLKKEIPEMLSDLKGQNLLKGFRGSKPVNLESLGDWLIRLGWLSLKFEEIEQIDVNPLLIVNGEPVAVDATIFFR